MRYCDPAMSTARSATWGIYASRAPFEMRGGLIAEMEVWRASKPKGVDAAPSRARRP